MNISKDGSLNELSPALLGRAASGARDFNRGAQAEKFDIGQVNRISQMLNGFFSVKKRGAGGIEFTKTTIKNGINEALEFQYYPLKDTIVTELVGFYLPKNIARKLVGVLIGLNEKTKYNSIDALYGLASIPTDGVHGNNPEGLFKSNNEL